MEYILQQLKVVLFHDFGYVSYCVEVASPPIPRCIFPGENCLAAFAAMLKLYSTNRALEFIAPMESMVTHKTEKRLWPFPKLYSKNHFDGFVTNFIIFDDL